MAEDIAGILIYETNNEKRLFMRLEDNKCAWFSQYDKRVKAIRKLTR